MDNFQHLVNSVWDFFKLGFADVNSEVTGVVIALIAAFILSSWGRLWIIALGAVIVHLIVDQLLPVLTRHQPFQLPPHMLEAAFLWHALALFVGYIVVIGVFFLIKRLFFKGGH